MNYSRQRELILETIRNNVVHPTAEYIHSVLEKTHGSMSIATLYRNLNQLVDNGIIKRIDGLETSSHFDHNTHEHFHFMCEKCKKVYDVSSDVAPDILARAEKELGAEIHGFDIVFRGICNDCK